MKYCVVSTPGKFSTEKKNRKLDEFLIIFEWKNIVGQTIFSPHSGFFCLFCKVMLYISILYEYIYKFLFYILTGHEARCIKILKKNKIISFSIKRLSLFLKSHNKRLNRWVCFPINSIPNSSYAKLSHVMCACEPQQCFT